MNDNEERVTPLVCHSDLSPQAVFRWQRRRRRRWSAFLDLPFLLLIPLLLLPTCAGWSMITVEWQLESSRENPVLSFLLDYSPPVGTPPPGTHLPAESAQVVINETLPAVEYTINITAIMADGQRHDITTKRMPSSPEAPVFESVETTSSEATISYFPPKTGGGNSEIGYYIEYHPIDRPEYANFVETRASLVKLRALDPATTYRLRIRSVFRGVFSENDISTTFATKDESGAEAVTIRTLPPNLDLFTQPAASTLPPNLDLFTQPAALTLLPPTSIGSGMTPQTTTKRPPQETFATSLIDTVDFVTTSTAVSTSPAVVVTSGEETSEPSTATTPSATTRSVFSIASSSTSIQTTAEPTTQATPFRQLESSVLDKEKPEEIDTESEESPAAPPANTTEVVIVGEDAKSIVGDEMDELVEEKGKTKHLEYKEYGPAQPIYLSMDGNMLRVDWNVPEGSLCDGYLLNYTIVSLSRPKSFSVSSAEPTALIKMYTDHKLDMKAFCLLSGALSKTWWAHRFADLSKPHSIVNLRVVKTETDDFYVSSIILDMDWPPLHDFNYYKILVSYTDGKTMKDAKELSVEERGPILIGHLEPTRWYTIAVKNVSVELDISSMAKTIKELTPPLISSTLYPGQISSTSININFGPSDPEQGRFGHYQLVFSGNSKNITKRIGIDDARSFTFTKLIPGKTYFFELFTVFEGRFSRPVTANVTTYPLKVNKLYPVIGRDYAVLFWDIENFADNDCRFRLSYTGTSSTGHQTSSTVVLKKKNSHRFDNLSGDTYYTFTITVIMGIGDAEAESESEMITVSLGQPARSVPQLQRLGTRELSVQFDNDRSVFSDLNGEIDNVAIIVTENIELGGDGYELQSWFEVKDEPHWSAYRASLSTYSPFKTRKKSATFVIGSEDCEQRSLDEPYCNGMLRANVNYMVKIRSYTKENIAMESEWVSIHGVADEDGEKDTKDRRPCHMWLNGCPTKSGPVPLPGCSFLSLIIASFLINPFL